MRKVNQKPHCYGQFLLPVPFFFVAWKGPSLKWARPSSTRAKPKAEHNPIRPLFFLAVSVGCLSLPISIYLPLSLHLSLFIFLSFLRGAPSRQCLSFIIFLELDRTSFSVVYMSTRFQVIHELSSIPGHLFALSTIATAEDIVMAVFVAGGITNPVPCHE